MSNKQSSIEFYIHNLIDILGDDVCNKLTIEQTNKIHNLGNQAAEMHKEEIEDVELRAKEIIIIKHTEHSTPIELPTDEEIKKEFTKGNQIFVDRIEGAKWMRDKIQGGNNEPK